MAERGMVVRDVAALDVARVGRVEETGDLLLPFRLVDEQGVEELAVTEFLRHLLADDASPASLRSYAYELLCWFRFLRAVEVPWHLASRVADERALARRSVDGGLRRSADRVMTLWVRTSGRPVAVHIACLRSVRLPSR